MLWISSGQHMQNMNDTHMECKQLNLPLWTAKVVKTLSPIEKNRTTFGEKHFEEKKKKQRLYIEYQYSLFHFKQSLTLCNPCTDAYKHFQTWSPKTIKYSSQWNKNSSVQGVFMWSSV